MTTRNTRNQIERKIIALPRAVFMTLPERAQFDPVAKAQMLESKYASRKKIIKQLFAELNIRQIWKDKKRAGSFGMVMLMLAMVIVPAISFDNNVGALSQGPNSATATGDCVNVAGANVDWTSPGNAFSSNNTYATASVDGTTTDLLRCMNFGFSIPAGATIDGIVAEVEKVASATNNGGVTDTTVNIVKAGSTIGTNKASGTAWTTTEAYSTYGTSSDLWGTTWGVSDINANNFGLAFAVTKANAAGNAITASVDHMRITVHYTPAPVVLTDTKLNQNGYIWENDDSLNGGTAQAAGNGSITGVRNGERLSLRMQIKNTGADTFNKKLGLFYDHNDGNFVEASGPGAKITSGTGCNSSSWNCTDVDTNSNTGYYNSLAFSPDGRPYISYHDTDTSTIHVAQYVGSGGTGCATAAWTCTEIENGNYGNDTSIAFSPDGKPYVAYSIMTSADLRIAQYVGSGGTGCTSGNTAWTCTTIDTASDVSQSLSLAFSPTGMPYIAYSDVSAADLRIAQYVGSGGTGCATAAWTCTAVDVNNAGPNVSIDFSPTGKPYISYSDESNEDLRVAQYVGSGGSGCNVSSWTCTTIDSTDPQGYNSSIAISPGGTPYISYRNGGSPGGVKVAQYVGSGGTGCATAAWTCTNVLLGGSFTAESNIRFGAGGNPVVSYNDPGSGNVGVAQYVGSGGSGCNVSSWTCTNIVGGGFYNSLAISPNGTPYASYWGGSGLGIAELKRSGSITVLSSTQSGSITSSHADMTTTSDSGNKTDADCIGGGTWQNGVVATGSEVSISLPSGACTEVVFTIDTSQAMYGQTYRFVISGKDSVRPDKGVWRGPISVASGAYATLTMAADNEAVSIRASKDVEPAGGSACPDDSTWKCTVLESNASGISINGPQDMKVSPGGDMYVLLHTEQSDGRDDNLVIAKYVGSGGTDCTSSAWTCETVDSRTGINYTASLAFGYDGKPVIAYGYSNSIYFAQYVGSGGTGCTNSSNPGAWQCTEVQSNVLAANLSMAINKYGVAGIAYKTNSSSDLGFAQYVGSSGTGCLSSSWTCSSIDTSNDIGGSPSIAYSNEGMPYISYLDVTNFDLKVARYVGSGGTGCATAVWQCMVVDNDLAGSVSSIQFSPGGIPYVAYYNYIAQVKLAHFVGSGGTGCPGGSTLWTCANTTGGGEFQIGELSLAFSPQGQPVVGNSTYDEYTTGFFDAYIRVDGGGYATALEYMPDGQALSVKIAFSHNGTPYLAYTNHAGNIVIAKREMNNSKPISTTLYQSFGGPNGVRADGRYRLSDGRAGRTNSQGNCIAGTGSLMGYCGLFNDDGYTDSIIAAANERPLNNFSIKTKTNSEIPTLSWAGRTTLAPNTAGNTGNLKMQVYRFGSTNDWVDVSVDSNSSNCSTDNCKLIGIPNVPLNELYESDGSDYRMYARVWQYESGSSSITLSTDSFQVQYLSGQMRHGIRFENGVKRPAVMGNSPR